MNENIENYLNKEKANELFKKPWGEIALFLIEIKEERKWSNSYRSFTSFVKDVSKIANVQQSVIWRIMTAAKFYLKISKQNKHLPTLINLSLIVPAENIELIEKISRYADSTTVLQTLDNSIHGLVTRNDLRVQWSVYKNSQKYPSDFKKIEGFESEYEKLVVKILNGKLGFRWLGADEKSFVKVFYMPLIPFVFKDGDQQHKYYPDMIIAFAKNSNSSAEFHVVEIISQLIQNTDAIVKKWKAARCTVEFFWILSREEHVATLLTILDDTIGLLVFSGDEIKVIRDAKVSNVFVESGNLAKKLITKT